VQRHLDNEVKASGFLKKELDKNINDIDILDEIEEMRNHDGNGNSNPEGE